MALRDKIVKIAYELKDKFSGRVSKITGSIRDVGAQSDKTTRKLERNNKRAGGSFDSLLAGANKLKFGLLALGAVIVGLAANVGKWISAANIQERAEKKLETSLRNLTNASTEQIQALKDQASALQELTGFGDELILSAQAQLATFQLTADQIRQLTPVLLDMGESQRKLGSDSVNLEKTALALGKAFSTGIGALGLYGVKLADAEKEAFKLGNQQEKVDIVVRALTNNFGGLAEEVGKLYEGAVRRANAAQGDFNETLGHTFTQNKDSIDFIRRMGEGWVNLGESVKESGREINATISFLFRTIKLFTGSVKVLFNFLQIGLKGTLALIDDTLALFALGLSKITFGSVSAEFERTAKSLAATSADLKKSLADDYFNDIGEGAKDVVDALDGMDERLDESAAAQKVRAEKRKLLADAAKRTADKAAAAQAKLTRATEEKDAAEKKAIEDKAKADKAAASAFNAALKQKNRALEDSLQKTKSIAAEFQQVIDDISGGQEKEAKDLNTLDVSESLLDAKSKLRSGDFDGAIDGARQTADMLKRMQEAGAESDIVLTGLAQQLKRFATEAAAGNQNNAQTTLDQFKQQSQQQLKALQDTATAAPIVQKVILDTTEAEAQLAALTQKAAQTITKTIFVNAQGNSFTDRPGQGFTELAREALKKGTK